jgi:hypothetical protein
MGLIGLILREKRATVKAHDIGRYKTGPGAD